MNPAGRTAFARFAALLRSVLERICVLQTFEALFFATAALLTALALAHVLPWTISRWMLSGASAVWSFSVFGHVVRRTWTAVGESRPNSGARPPESRSPVSQSLVVVAISAVVLASARDLILGLLRTIGGYSDLVFNIDGRFLLMHSWSILHRGGTSEVLSMAGTPLSYHTGPAWFAAALASIFDGGPGTWLLLWFPLAAVLTVFAASFELLRRLGATAPVALVGLAVAVSPLWDHLSIAGTRSVAGTAMRVGIAPATGQLIELILGSTQTNMMNSLLGAAAILVAAAYFLGAPSRRRFLTSNCLVAFSALSKPQYAIAGSILLFAVGMASSPQSRLRRWEVVGLPVLAAVGSVGLQQVLLGNTTVLVGVRGGGESFSIRWDSVDPFLLAEPQFVFMLLLPAALVAMSVPLGSFHRRVLILLASIAAGLFAFWFLVHLVVASAGSSVSPEVLEWAWNSMQVRLPLLSLGTAAAVAVGVEAIMRSAPRIQAVLAMALLVSAASSGHELWREWIDPEVGHEAVDAPYVRELLRGVDPESALIVASDLSDPAQNHRRSGSAFYLSNAYGHQFWITQTRYGHQFVAETAPRVRYLERFFGTDWSSWHAHMLAEEEVTHVMISERCPPVWDPRQVPMLTAMASVDGWALYAVGPPSGLWDSFHTPNRAHSLTSTPRLGGPLFGQAGCN